MTSDKILWQNEWLAVKEKDDWTYTHSVKSNGEGVAVLGYTINPFRVLARFENIPCHNDGIALASLTGMMDHDGEDYITTAARELKEESGFDADKRDFFSLGVCRPSKSSDTIIYLYAVRLNYKEGKQLGVKN